MVFFISLKEMWTGVLKELVTRWWWVQYRIGIEIIDIWNCNWNEHVAGLYQLCYWDPNITGTERSPGWQRWYSLETLKLAFNVSCEYQGCHPGDILFVLVLLDLAIPTRITSLALGQSYQPRCYWCDSEEYDCKQICLNDNDIFHS